MIGNRYEMVLVATARARELKKENHSVAKSNILTALEEIEDGKVGREYLHKYAKGNRVSRHHRF
jgi:DNA-directed RNA polymerase omega subunit